MGPFLRSGPFFCFAGLRVSRYNLVTSIQTCLDTIIIRLKQTGYICLLIFSVALVADAQGRNSIEGRVVGTDGLGIEEARVLLKNGNLTDIGQDITDSLGNYRFTSVAEGIYYLEVLPIGTGYERQTRRIEISSLSRRPGGSAEIYRHDF